MTNEQFIDAFGGIDSRFILSAAVRIETARAVPRRSRGLRVLLIAAVIATLLGATAYAMGVLGLGERVFPVEGTERVVVVPNGLKGTPTYEGTGEWWSWTNEHRNDRRDDMLSFLRSDDRKRKTCELYQAYSIEAAEKLYEIAERYELRLYSESVMVDSMEKLSSFTGILPFLKEGETEISSGYVFPDGSFKAEGAVFLDEHKIFCVLQRFSTGALYPYGGVTRLPDYSEEDYVSALSQNVDIVYFPGNRVELWYLSGDGEIFAALQFSDLESTMAKTIADRIDFTALCEKNDAVEQIVSVPRGAADNREAARRLEDFYQSAMFSAAREFQSFFTVHFYGASFTGVHGQEGYADIDAELERLAEKYGLRYAGAKTVDGPVTRYDNGVTVWEGAADGDPGSVLKTMRIPKDALYTGMIHYVPPESYQRIWVCETEEGQQIVCFTDGPEKISGVCLLWETEKTYVLISLGCRDAAAIEAAAESIDWTRFDKEG